jgi:hypothetical protein
MQNDARSIVSISTNNADNCANHFGQDCRTVDRSDIYADDNCDSTQDIISQELDLPINIYRYKFTQDFMNVLYGFSKVHQYDDRKSYKEAWTMWIEDNEEIVSAETARLLNLRYDGDIIDKMFKSARYYFRKKSTTKPEPKDRRQYMSVHKDLLDAMDEQIYANMKQIDYKPSDGFVNFCNTSVELLKEEVTRFVVDQGVTDITYIKNKIKKTYKNRYYMIVSK